jgi:hypothetical protein
LANFLLDGYIFPDESPLARDENNYVSFSIRYRIRFLSVASLRPEIKVELSARTSLLPLKHLLVRLKYFIRHYIFHGKSGCYASSFTLCMETSDRIN